MMDMELSTMTTMWFLEIDMQWYAVFYADGSGVFDEANIIIISFYEQL
jgi:hypothetical protein